MYVVWLTLLFLSQPAGIKDDFYFAQRGSDSKYLNRSADCERALESSPDDAQALLCHGAALCFRARAAYNGILRDDKPLLLGLRDFETLLAAREPVFSTLSDLRRGELLFALAEGWARAGDEQKARRYFERLAKELPNTPYVARASSWLNNRSLTPVHLRCVGCHVR